MHRSVDVVQEIVRLGDQLETVAKKALLNLLLARGEELIGVAGLKSQRESHAGSNSVECYFGWDLFDDGIDVDDVVFSEAFVVRTGRFVARLVLIFAHGEL